MAKNKRTRKAHRPQPPRVPVIFRYGADAELELHAVPHAALLQLRNGMGSESIWDDLAVRINIGSVLAHDIFPAHQPLTARALDALLSVRARFERTGKFGCSGDEAVAIGAGLVTTDAMQRDSTMRQQRDAMRIVDRINREDA